MIYKTITLFILLLFTSSCEFKNDKEFKTKRIFKGILDTNKWEMVQAENIKFLNNKTWVKRHATGILFTAFFDSTKNDIYTIVKRSLNDYNAHKYIIGIMSYINNDTNSSVQDYEILEYSKKQGQVIMFYVEYQIYEENRSNYELMYEYKGYLYTIGLNLKNEGEKTYTDAKYSKKQLFQLLYGKFSVDNELIFKDNEEVGEFKTLYLEDL